MKRLKTIYTLLLLAVALPFVTACTNDDAAEDNTRKGEKVTVRLRISQAAPAMTRAGSTTKDPNADPKELMNVWTVVITNTSGVVQKILACEPLEGDREIDPIETTLELETNTYNFYSFANISPEYVKYLLGISTAKPTSDATFNNIAKGDIVDIPLSGTPTITNAEGKTIGINGNYFDIDANSNDFLSKGIPMSNMQTIRVTKPVTGETAQLIDLIVVRMLAKIKLQIYNDKASDITIESITLTDITKNASENNGTANLKLFPRYTYTNGDENVFPGADEKVDYEHGDIRPNLTNEATKDVLKITPSSSGVTVLSASSSSSDPLDPWTIPASNYSNDGAPLTITFYVNESENPKGENWDKATSGTLQQFNHYFLKIKITGEEEERYALIDDNGTKEGEKWNYIARNDYRIIPIVLDDYKLDMIPYDFPAIGVYPASMKEEDGIYTITFHDYGHFHLQPQVTKYSDASTPKEVVPYGSSSTTGNTDKTYWTLVEGENNAKTWENSWGSWTDATKTTAYSGGFYRTSTDTKDGDDAGGVPVWYENAPSNPLDPSTPSNPRWASDWAPNSGTGLGYQPFIFGYIADPEGKPTPDKKVYHEFSINLYKRGTGAARQMTYRLYMILDTGQMMYPDPEDSNGSRALGAPAFRHTHGH